MTTSATSSTSASTPARTGEHRPALAVVGVTGAVGREMLAVLEQRRFPHSSLRLFASERSAGRTVAYCGEPITIEPLRDAWHVGIDLALFSAGSSISKRFIPKALAAGVLVVDNSSAYRADPDCPLIVAEVNPDALHAALRARGRTGMTAPGSPGLCACVPNCSAIIMLVALDPLRRAFGIRRITVSTYQAASGAGAQAMEELRTQTRQSLDGVAPDALSRNVFPEPYAFNLFSHNAGVDPATGYNGEELKMISESRRIWNDPGVLISPTCVRVPTMRAHAESITVTLERAATRREILTALEAARDRGVRIVDDPAANSFPTPLKATGGDDVLVGRLRPDIARLDELAHASAQADRNTTTQANIAGHALDAPCDTWSLFVAGDQLRTGAALTAVKIAELMCAHVSRT